MFLLDTNTLIYFFKGVGNVAANMLAIAPSDIAIPAIVVYELEFGIAKSSKPEKQKAQLEQVCSLVDILPFTKKEAKASAIIRASLQGLGTPIGPYDVLIAGTALAAGCTLVTNNVREFQRVPDLQIANWA